MKTCKILIVLFGALLTALIPGLASADLESLKQDAMRGQVDSQLELGMLYEFGYHYADHDVDALAWYSIAEDNGNKQAGERRAVVEGRLSAVQREAARARESELRALMPAATPSIAPAETTGDASGAPAPGPAGHNSVTADFTTPAAIP